MGTGFSTADRLVAIKYRLGRGYPGATGRLQAKVDVAVLLFEVENMRRAVAGFLAPKNDNGLKVPHGGKDEGGDREADRASHTADQG